MEKTEYQFRIRAMNEEGSSEPSPPSSPVLLKAKNGEWAITRLLLDVISHDIKKTKLNMITCMGCILQCTQM